MNYLPGKFLLLHRTFFLINLALKIMRPKANISLPVIVKRLYRSLVIRQSLQGLVSVHVLYLVSEQKKTTQMNQTQKPAIKRKQIPVFSKCIEDKCFFRCKIEHFTEWAPNIIISWVFLSDFFLLKRTKKKQLSHKSQ